MLAIGTVVKTIGSSIYEYAANLPGGITFLIANGDELLIDKDIGIPCLVQYTPGDQFCEVLDLEEVASILIKHSSTIKH